jgi:mRNA interferase MazF
MALQKGDIVLVNFPFTDLSQAKLRPAIVLSANETLNEFALCFITSQNTNQVTPEEFVIDIGDSEFSKTGLKISSKVRVTRLVTLQRQLIVKRLGKLGNQYMQTLNTLIIQAFQLGQTE